MGYGKPSRKALQDEKVGRGGDFWAPPEGESRIRILPPWSEDAEQFWFHTGMHWGVGPDERPVPCPAETGVRDSCWLCRLVNRLKRDEDDETAQEEADQINAAASYLINIVDYDSPEDGVQTWRCGVKAFRKLKRLWLNDEEYGDMTDLENGYDIIVTKTGSGRNSQYDVTPARNNTAFPSKKLLDHRDDAVAEMYQKLADEELDLPNLAELQEFPSDKEMENIYKGTSSGRRTERSDDDNGDDDGEEEEKPRRRRAAAKEDEDGEEPEEGEGKKRSRRVRGRLKNLD